MQRSDREGKHAYCATREGKFRAALFFGEEALSVEEYDIENGERIDLPELDPELYEFAGYAWGSGQSIWRQFEEAVEEVNGFQRKLYPDKGPRTSLGVRHANSPRSGLHGVIVKADPQEGVVETLRAYEVEDAGLRVYSGNALFHYDAQRKRVSMSVRKGL